MTRSVSAEKMNTSIGAMLVLVLLLLLLISIVVVCEELLSSVVVPLEEEEEEEVTWRSWIATLLEGLVDTDRWLALVPLEALVV